MTQETYALKMGCVVRGTAPEVHLSQNDLNFLESNFKNWLEARANGLEKDQFVYYCAEHFLKPHDPTDESPP